MFESFANSERYKTSKLVTGLPFRFESFANSERYKTLFHSIYKCILFESFANSERYKTGVMVGEIKSGLRALLIQKDTKPLLEL